MAHPQNGNDTLRTWPDASADSHHSPGLTHINDIAGSGRYAAHRCSEFTGVLGSVGFPRAGAYYDKQCDRGLDHGLPCGSSPTDSSASCTDVVRPPPCTRARNRAAAIRRPPTTHSAPTERLRVDYGRQHAAHTVPSIENAVRTVEEWSPQPVGQVNA